MRGSPAAIASRLHALLGPTNTGKTHACIGRMLEHETGMFGLPLRLLAREVYDRVVAQVGTEAVALVTGEERRVPARPRYWICTVEAMPVSVEVEFLAIDEVQLMSHPHRGHVFTERVLNARGTVETWFLGSASVRPLLEQLIPSAQFKSQPRFSRLSFLGDCSLGSVPPRSAIVAFSASGVYELAERVRARRGGAAVVLGALSPRTRNAQVALYQAGEVDYLVATDAIGMGLNLAINHVALAGLRKFDGKESRELHVSELAQVAGRAGRYLNDGSFGTLNPSATLPHAIALKIENHKIPLERRAWFRSSSLDFTSIEALQASLNQRPKVACLQLMNTAEDAVALGLAARHPEIRRLATSAERVELLWAVCQIPDYRKLLPEIHNDLLRSIYEELNGQQLTLSEDWLAQRIARLDDTTGDIDTLLGRLSFVRTWTYVVNHRAWVRRSRYWQERTAALEDSLSDALHERLVQRFVERTRRSVAFRPNARRPSAQATSLSTDRSEQPGTLGGPFAQLWELKLRMERLKAGPEVVATPQNLLIAGDDQFRVSPPGVVNFGTQSLARLVAGKSLLAPEVRIEERTTADSLKRAPLERRLREVVRAHSVRLLTRLQDKPDDSASLRGILYQLRSNLGTTRTTELQPILDALTLPERTRLVERGVVIGRYVVYLPALLRAEAIRQRLMFGLVYFGTHCLPATVDASRVSFPRESAWTPAACLSIGYVAAGPRLVRCDALERALALQAESPAGSSEMTPHAHVAKLSSTLGCRPREVAYILRPTGVWSNHA
jgi:ATP-dependent RNA helicase SUPV3L1/SUV3